jgi:hypothetical protein
MRASLTPCSFCHRTAAFIHSFMLHLKHEVVVGLCSQMSSERKTEGGGGGGGEGGIAGWA